MEEYHFGICANSPIVGGTEMIYAVLFLIIAIFSFVEIFIKLKNQTNILFVTLISFVFLIMSSIRWQRGTDWNSYYIFFMGDPLHSWQHWELGYKYLNYVVKILSGNQYTVFLLVCAVIVYYFQRNSIIGFAHIQVGFNNQEGSVKAFYPISMLLGIWCIQLGNVFVVRSTLAYIILFYSIKFIQHKNLIRFLIFIIIATLFHWTAIVFIPAYFVYHFRFSKKIAVVSLLLVPITIRLFLPALLTISSVLGGIYAARTQLYLIQGSGQSASLLGLLDMIFLLVLFLAMYIKRYSFDSQYSGMLKLFYVGFLIYIGAYITSPVFFRLSAPYVITQVILLPYLIGLSHERYAKFIIFILMLLYLAFRLDSTLSDYWNLYIPFKSIFDPNLPVTVY
jgi:hypothetical protein